MSPERRKKAVPSRRRRADEGEEEESVLGDVDDDSLSDTSVISNDDEDADAEASEISADEDSTIQSAAAEGSTEVPSVATKVQNAKHMAAANGTSKNSADTNATLNGLNALQQAEEQAGEEHHGDLGAQKSHSTMNSPLDYPQLETKQESLAERNRREHQEYLKQRNTNPAFVPNRGGFFLHDNRTLPPGSSNFRFAGRGRGRGSFNAPPYGRGGLINEPTERPWAHDLHETVAKPETQSSTHPQGTFKAQLAKAIPPGASQPHPNRSFSSSITLGNVAVRIFLPGMTQKVSVPNVVRKQHTLLPHHRPPLRRDKPVRISLPDIAPLYVFPSTERSFIFIPRAMRPNQGYNRGRGRGSFHGSRRTSIFGGSGYAPSVAMSRKSSIGPTTPRDGVRSPAGSVMSSQAMHDPRMSRPIVRMPVAMQTLPPHGNANVAPVIMQPINSVNRENQQQVLPMHQPRPQKNVSVADIESPASFTFNPPQQQEEQPFHQQVPLQVGNQPYGGDPASFNPQSRRPSHPGLQAGTPLNQIPGRAIFAQPFQPYPLFPPAGYYAPPAFSYQSMSQDSAVFGGMGPQMLPPPFIPGAQPGHFGAPQQLGEDARQANMVAHESNGMVYYYDPSQLPSGTRPPPITQYAMGPSGGVVGMGGMITPPAHYYYPTGPNGMYFGPQ